MQGKRRGDPGTDPSTVEPIPVLRARLWSFWSSLFPSTLPTPSPTAPSSRQILYTSHGAAIREFIRSIVEDRVDNGGVVDGWEWSLQLPRREEEVLRSGSKRIDNCSRTVIEVVDEGEGGAFFPFPILPFPLPFRTLLSYLSPSSPPFLLFANLADILISRKNSSFSPIPRHAPPLRRRRPLCRVVESALASSQC